MIDNNEQIPEEVVVEEVDSIEVVNDEEIKPRLTRHGKIDKRFGEKVLTSKGGKASVAAREKKYTFKDLMYTRLTNAKRKEIATYYINKLTDEKVRLSERIKILELILKMTGELDNKAMVAVEDTDKKITLVIN